ncbi:MAG: PQQ-binding-like beta-propeller repeat protein [Bdellovibrionales bacterium]|nr:PQQ-binding-like beta-propeller repeat protein [Bdellovibrionales bacterium]
MIKKLVLASPLLLLGACAHLRSSLPKSPLRVTEFSTKELPQGVFAGNSLPGSSVAPRFLDNDDVLLATMGGNLEVRDVRTLSPRWTRSSVTGFSAQPLLLGSFVVAASMDAKLYKIRLATGEIEWTSHLPAETAGGISASQGLLYVTTQDDSISAFDEKRGTSVWNYKRPAKDGTNVQWSLRGSAVPALSADGKTVYAGFSDGAFVAFEASSGKTLWERNFDRPGRFKDADTSPVLSPDGAVIYLALVDGDLVALRARDGSTLWSLAGAASTAPFIDFQEKAIYLSTRDSRVNKISLEDNHVIWSADLGARGLGSRPATVLDGYLSVSTSRTGVVILDRKTGALVWEANYGLGTVAAPSFDGKRLAVISGRNKLHLYSVEKRM